jgi:hypothetical protein
MQILSWILKHTGQASTSQNVFLTLTLILVLALFGLVSTYCYGNLAHEYIGRDFIGYWAAGRLLLSGNDPYASKQVAELQQSVGITNAPIMMHNPPWVLTFILPFCMQNYITSKLLWLMFNFALLIFCVYRIWLFCGGSKQYRWYVLLVVFTFSPALIIFSLGQITPLILLGIVSFLYFEKKHQYWLAGSYLLLVAINPALLYLLWVVLPFWALYRRYYQMLLSLMLSGLAATIIPMFYNPNLMNQYVNYMCNGYTLHFMVPTLGTQIRLIFGIDRLWLMFILSSLGMVWVLCYWGKHRKTWEWDEQMPLLLLVSLMTTLFSWSLSYVLLLFVILQATIWVLQTRQNGIIVLGIIVYLLISIMAVVIRYIHQGDDMWSLWLVPSLLISYLALRNYIKKEKVLILKNRLFYYTEKNSCISINISPA